MNRRIDILIRGLKQDGLNSLETLFVFHIHYIHYHIQYYIYHIQYRNKTNTNLQKYRN